MLLTGLPGMGKSTALEQAAARWAADSDAPVPVLVQLRDLARRDPRRGADITLPVLIQVATDSAPEHERTPLRAALEKAAASGEAVLLLDGLDECQDRVGVVADGLANVAAGLPGDTGIVLGTRDSGMAAAGKLNMPEARLAEPQWLGSVLTQLLRHAAAARRVPQDEQDHWVGERKQQVDQIRVSHPDLWRVPLFATMLTLLAASREPGTLPSSRAQLMAEAVQDTVHRWELTRQQQDAPGLSGEHSSTGTARSPTPSRPAQAPARQPACSSGWRPCSPTSGDMRRQKPGHRHGTLWRSGTSEPASSWPPPRRRTSSNRAAASSPRPATLCGPPGRNPRHDASGSRRARRRRPPRDGPPGSRPCSRRDHLPGRVSCRQRVQRGSALACPGVGRRCRRRAPGTAAPALRALIGELTRAARDAAAATPEPPAMEAQSSGHRRADATPLGWQYVHRIAVLPIPAELRPDRDRALDELELDDGQQTIAEALAALADATADARDTLDSGQEEAVRRLLAVPLPERHPAAPSAPGPGTPGPASKQAKPLPGHIQAAEQAARYAPQLGSDAASAIYQIARRGSLRQYSRVRAQLTALGYQDPDPPRVSLSPEGISLGELTEHFWDPWEVLLQAAASIAPPRPLSRSERWRYPDIAELADVLDIENASLDGINHALSTDPAFLAGWLRAVAHAVGLDLPGIAAQAQAALQSLPAGNRDIIYVMFARHRGQRRNTTPPAWIRPT